MINQLAAAAHGFDEIDVAEFRRWKEAGSPIVPRGTADLPGPPTGSRNRRSKVSFKTNSRTSTSTSRRRPKPFSSTPAQQQTVRTAAVIEQVPRHLQDDVDAIEMADFQSPPTATRAALAAKAAEKRAVRR